MRSQTRAGGPVPPVLMRQSPTDYAASLAAPTQIMICDVKHHVVKKQYIKYIFMSERSANKPNEGWVWQMDAAQAAIETTPGRHREREISGRQTLHPEFP
jgi:hypothetical protein